MILDVRKLTDEQVIEMLNRMAARERRFTVRQLRLLVEMDKRKLAEKRAFGSLFDYCTQKLKHSEAMAYWRIRSARAAQKCPEILDLIESGDLNITTVAILHPHLDTPERHNLVQAARGKTRKQVESLVAALAPAAPRRDAIGRIATSTGSAEWPAAPTPTPTGPMAPQPGQPTQPISFSFDKIEAVDGQKVRLHFDVGPETAKLLERAREVMRHKFPLASFEDIVREALKLLLEERDPEIKLKLEKEDAKKVLTDARRVPVWVQRKVWRRDGGRCAYVAEDGTRCEERKWLEYDHVVPYAKGGRSDDPKNIRLLCRSHNQLNGWLEFPPGPTASA